VIASSSSREDRRPRAARGPIRPIEPGEQVEQRGLADAGLAHDREILARSQRRDRCPRTAAADRAIALAQILEPAPPGGRRDRSPERRASSGIDADDGLDLQEIAQAELAVFAPLPDILKPPNGVCMSPEAPFSATWPARMRPPTRRARTLSFDQT
jgi:hypothetical protein